MGKKLIIGIIITAIILVLVSWSPWIIESYAEKRVLDAFNENWEGIMNGCGFNCNGCGLLDSHRTLFDYSVKIEYACGMLPIDSPEHHNIETKFVSFMGTIN